MRIPSILLFSLAAHAALGQRQWGLNDSTSYAVGGDTILAASRTGLYRVLPGGTVFLRDFAVAEDPDLYIRDVDHWSSSDLYVLVGSRYIGYPTILWRSIDAGATWAEDETFLPATETVSVNQMAITPDGTAYLFNGYYMSEVLRSMDHGATWSRWFHSLIAHYYGILPCQGTAFIYGMIGDAFRPALWEVPDTLWAQEDVQFWSGCHNIQPGCYYPPSGVSAYPDVVAYFEDLVQTSCMTLTVPDGQAEVAPLLPVLEPGGGAIRLSGLDPRAMVEVFDALGRPVRIARQGDRCMLPGLAGGAYSVVARTDRGVRYGRFIVR